MLFLESRNSLRHKEQEELPVLGNVPKGITNLFMDLTGEVNGSFSITDSMQSEFGIHSLQILSTTACLSIMTGPLSVYEGQKKIRLSEKVQDIKGQILGWLQCFRGGLRFTAGSLFVPASGMNVILFFTMSKTLAVVASFFKEAGGTLLGVASLLLSMSAILLLVHAFEFRQKIHEMLQEPEGAFRIIQMLKGDMALGRTGDLLHATNGACVDEVRHAELHEAEKIVELILDENNKKILISLLYLGLSAISTIITFASFFIAAESALVVLAILDTTIGLIWLGLDVFALGESFKDSEFGKYDLSWMCFTFVMSVIIIVAATICAQSIVANIVTLTVGSILLAAHWYFFIQDSSYNQ